MTSNYKNPIEWFVAKATIALALDKKNFNQPHELLEGIAVALEPGTWHTAEELWDRMGYELKEWMADDGIAWDPMDLCFVPLKELAHE